MRVDGKIDHRGSNPVGADALIGHRFLPTRAGVIELVVLFALLLVIERMFMAPGDFARLQPHPFWLPIILLSLQYGSADGVLAAAVAIILCLLMGWPSQGVGEDYYRYVIRVWAVPIGWIMTSIIVGEVRARQRIQISILKRDLLTTRAQAHDITGHCFKLEEKIQRIERAFATAEATSLDSLSASLKDLQDGDRRTWSGALMRAHRSLIGIGTLRFYMRADNGWVAVGHANSGPVGEADVVGRIGPAAFLTLAEKVAAGRRLLSALNAEDAAVLEGICAMAVPVGRAAAGLALTGQEPRLVDTRSLDGRGRATGILLLESVPPERLTVDTENRLALLGREITHMLSMAGSDDLIEETEPGHLISLPASEPAATPLDAEPAARRVGLFQRFGRA